MIGSPKKAPAASAPGNVTPQKLDTNEQSRVVPYYAGRRWFPLTWLVSNVYNATATPITSKVGKSTKTTGYRYGGDVAGLVCLGPNDYIEAIEVDGQIVWSGFIERDGGHPDHSGDIVVPGAETGCGTYRLHWGTETQVQANFIVCGAGAPETHPDYRGQCFLECKGLVFGEGRTTPPNIRVLVERAARFGGLLDENRSREGANGITALAEVIGNTFYGLGRPDLVNIATWDALCTDIQRPQTQAVPGDLTHTAVMGYMSPYMENATTLQAFAGQVLENFDGWIRRKAGVAELEIGRFPHDGIVPGGLLELTLDDLADKPQFDSPGYSDTNVVTDVVVKAIDRDWNMEPTPQIGANAAARQRLGERRVKSFDRPFVHTSYQARAQANELVNFYSRPETQVSDKFRREKVATLLPGDRFIFNWGPSSFRQVMRVISRRDPGAGGSVDLTYVVERGLAPLGYVATAQAAPALPEPPAPAAITTARLFQLPIGFLADPAPAIAPLASRPTVNSLGLDLYFSTDDITYDAIAQTKRWALHGALQADLVAGTGIFNISAAGPELVLLATQSAAAQNDDTLLLICGFEIMSIGGVVAVGGGIYTVSVLRGRRGSAAAAHNHVTDDVYIIPRGDLEIVQHESFPRTVINEYFKLRTFTPQDEQLLAAALRIVFPFAGATTAQPTVLPATGKAEAIFLAWTLPTMANGAADPTIVTVEIAELAHGAAAPANGSATPHDFEGYANGFNRGGLAAGTQKDYYFRCRDKIDDVSDWVGPVTATANAAPAGSVWYQGVGVPAGGLGANSDYYLNTTNDDVYQKVGGVWGLIGNIHGDAGIPGPGLVYVGEFNAANIYYCTTARIDVVSSGGTYYRATNAAKSGTNTWGAPGGGDWSAPDATFKFVATDLLLAQDVTILKTLVMGDGATLDGGIIRSVGATDLTTGDGYWLNPRNAANKAEFRIGTASKYLKFDGSAMTLATDSFTIPSALADFTVDIDSTFVGPFPPARIRLGNALLFSASNNTTCVGRIYNGGMMFPARAATSDVGFLIIAGATTFVWTGAYINQRDGKAYFLGLTLDGDLDINGTAKVNFAQASGLAYFDEGYGGRYHGDASHPFQVRASALCLDGCSGGGTNYTVGRIYLSDSVYLYESGGLLYLNDGNGDRALT